MLIYISLKKNEMILKVYVTLYRLKKPFKVSLGRVLKHENII